MSDLSLALVYFSGTDLTKFFSLVIREALTDLGCLARLFAVTPYASQQKPLPFSDFQAFIFGFSVFGDFAPSVINAWTPTQERKGKPCSRYFT